MAAEAVGRYRLYGATIDDAVGEAFDKTAKLLGLPYPGGPQIEAAARSGNAKHYPLPRPMLGREGADFSFSGLKTAIRLIARDTALTDKTRADLAASFQAAVVPVMIDRVRAAMEIFRTEFGNSNAEMKLVAAGGVAANCAIRAGLENLAQREGYTLSVPPPALCTDNAAMVAWAGLERLACGLTDSLDTAPLARWPLQELDSPAGSVTARDRLPRGPATGNQPSRSPAW